MKLVLRIFISLVIAGLIGIGYLVYIFETSIDKVLSIEQQTLLYASIEDTPELPSNFYTVLEKYYPDYYTQSVWHSVFNQLIFQKNNQCQFRDVYLPFLYTNRKVNSGWIPFHKTELVIALEIEKRFSQKKCYAFNMSITEFGMNTRNITEAARLYYNKELNQLSEQEILALNIIRKAPSYYNPIINPDRLNQKVKSIIK